MREPNGILLLDKAAGMTSRQAAEAVGKLLVPVRRRRRQDERRFRVGHAGTLDPLATGLLLILVGRGTRLAPFLQGLDKRYLATVRLGAGTDSHDGEGSVTALAAVPPEPTGLKAALELLRAKILQVPPVISSIKQGGRSLHRLVRAGRDVAEPPARPVRIDRLEILALRWGLVPTAADDAGGRTAPDGLLYEIDLDIACASGTYVRALARDLGQALGTLGHVQALRRLVVGPFVVDQAVALADLEQRSDPQQRIVPLVAALPHLPAFDLDLAQADRVRHGGQPQEGWLPQTVPALFRLIDPRGALAAIGRRDPGSGQPVTVVVFPQE